MKVFLRSLLAVTFLFCLFLFAACSNTLVTIISHKMLLVFDYSSGGTPIERLAVFVQPSGNFERIRSLTVENADRSLSWTIDNLTFVNDGQDFWTGSPFLVQPSNNRFENETYHVIVTNHNADINEIPFTLEYPTAIRTATAEDILLKKGQSGDFADLKREYLIVYDADGNVLFFGLKSQKLSQDSHIRAEYPQASATQLYVESVKNTYAVLLPKQILKD